MRKEYDFTKSRPNPYSARLKKAVTIRLDEPTIAYFKALADETGIGYQTLINSFLRDCASSKRRPTVRWARSKGAAQHPLAADSGLPDHEAAAAEAASVRRLKRQGSFEGGRQEQSTGESRDGWTSDRVLTLSHHACADTQRHAEKRRAERGTMTQPAGRPTRRAWFCAVALLAVAGCAAKAPARSFSALQQSLKPDSTVFVIDSSGSETKGTVVNVSPSTLILEVDGVQRRMEQESVRQVQSYGDSLWNGFLIGMAVGTSFALISDPMYEPCPDNAQMRCANPQVGQRILGVGVMAGVGVGIDALIRGRHQVYLAAGQSAGSRARVAVTPRVGVSTAALFITVRP